MVPSTTSSDVMAFQMSALTFNGSIGKVQNSLQEAFPLEGKTPDISQLPLLYTEAASHLADALKPLMDVSSSNLTLRGRLGLTPAVVYLSVLLTHHNRVMSGSHLQLRRRGGSAEDRLVTAGQFLTSTDRLAALKSTLPSWFVHDSLLSIFSGSRAYELANSRVWRDFTLGGPARSAELVPS